MVFSANLFRKSGEASAFKVLGSTGGTFATLGSRSIPGFAVQGGLTGFGIYGGAGATGGLTIPGFTIQGGLQGDDGLGLGLGFDDPSDPNYLTKEKVFAAAERGLLNPNDGLSRDQYQWLEQFAAGPRANEMTSSVTQSLQNFRAYLQRLGVKMKAAAPVPAPGGNSGGGGNGGGPRPGGAVGGGMDTSMMLLIAAIAGGGLLLLSSKKKSGAPAGSVAAKVMNPLHKAACKCKHLVKRVIR